jgi:DNA-binding response OmpR family regulator
VTKILIVDDNSSMRAFLRTLLERAGHCVIEAPDGLDGVRRLYAEQPDLVILDVKMPGLDGWGTLERIRELSDVPVLMLSAIGDDRQRTRGLLAGADDFQPKPFGGPELLARVTALIRRAKPQVVVPEVVGDGWARVDVQRHEAVVDGIRLTLTPLEFRLLGAFLRHPGVALSHDQLIELVWQESFGTREQVKVAVLALRRKLDAATPDGSDAVETVRGVGYRWIGAAPVPA